MLFEFYLTKGFLRNLLIDTNKEIVYFLPSQKSDLKEIIMDYTNYPIDKRIINSEHEYLINSYVEIIEFQYHIDQLTYVLNLSSILLTDFLIIHIQKQDDIFYLTKQLIFEIESGMLSLRQIYFILDDNTDYEFNDFYHQLFSFVKADFFKKSRKIEVNNFKPQASIIYESLKHNTFYNRRIFIDQTGKITALADDLEIMNITDVCSPDSLLNNSKLLEIWNSSKEKIDVCSVCEFRNICIDSTPLKKRTGKEEFFRSEHCDYNPFINRWKGEIDYYSLSDCGVISNEVEFFVDYERVRYLINKQTKKMAE